MPDEISQKKQWDNTYQNTQDFFGKEPSELATSALPTLKDHDVRTVLELGCGQGRDTWYFARNGMAVTAMDYSESGICQMQEAAKRGNLDEAVTAKAHDAREPLPFPDGSFDAIYSHMFFTMEFTEEEVSMMLDDCRRVLRPGGLNIFSVRNDHDPHYGKFEPRGKDMWKNPMGFIVHFFTEEKLRQLSRGYELLWIKEFEDRSPPFTKKLYEVVLQKPG
jgi:SAM-dependent methyltransferase